MIWNTGKDDKIKAAAAETMEKYVFCYFGISDLGHPAKKSAEVQNVPRSLSRKTGLRFKSVFTRERARILLKVWKFLFNVLTYILVAVDQHNNTSIFGVCFFIRRKEKMTI